MSTTTTTELQMQDGDVPGAPLLQVRDLNVTFHTRDGDAKAINGVDLDLAEGETLAILGESGSGKSVTAQCIMGILDMPPGEITSGTVHFRGQELLQMPEKQRRNFRGQRIAMIFQDALSALNPVYTVGFQIGEMFTVHRGMSRKDAKARAIELMERVRIPGARSRVNDYPHQFSGGMRQRIMIATAIALEPDILIADEPTTALDVTVQAQIMELLADLRRETGSGLILITHDLGVVAEVADRINVMYAGRVIEQGKAMDAFVQPAHPYTQGLLDSLPRLDSADEATLRHQGPAAQPDAHPARLPLLPALPAGPGHLPQQPAAGRTSRWRPGTSAPAISPRRCTPVASPLAEAPTLGKDGLGETVLEVKGLVKHYPLRRGIVIRRQIGAVQAVDGVDLSIRRGETLGRRRRIRLRQVDLGPADGWPRAADRRIRRGAGSQLRQGQGPRPEGHPARHPDDLPGSLHLAEPEDDGRRHHRRAAGDP